jgi:hypothetical protein
VVYVPVPPVYVVITLVRSLPKVLSLMSVLVLRAWRLRRVAGYPGGDENLLGGSGDERAGCD